MADAEHQAAAGAAAAAAAEQQAELLIQHISASAQWKFSLQDVNLHGCDAEGAAICTAQSAATHRAARVHAGGSTTLQCAVDVHTGPSACRLLCTMQDARMNVLRMWPDHALQLDQPHHVLGGAAAHLIGGPIAGLFGCHTRANRTEQHDISDRDASILRLDQPQQVVDGAAAQHNGASNAYSIGCMTGADQTCVVHGSICSWTTRKRCLEELQHRVLMHRMHTQQVA
jgi:hypothetical protein